MEETSKDIQLQYEGFLNTPLLWKKNNASDLTQFEILTGTARQFNTTSKPEIRLGKRVEQFCFFTFEQDKTIHILSENIQIQDGKRTVGELDCLLLKNKQPIHIEIVYKFYLYDKTVGETEIEHWIGPNRRDSFHQKITKLQSKQLPLLKNEHTQKYLDNLQLVSEQIHQKVYFKGQLFVPLKDINQTFSEINNNCIYGFYIYFNQLNLFEDCKFYIPTKVNWLQNVHLNVNWHNFDNFKSEIEVFHSHKSAPLCWLKKPNGELKKFFIVWW